MATSISSAKSLDVGDIGFEQANLPPFDQGALDLAKWYDADAQGRPLDIEIGSGKGTFLVQQAERTPDVNFLGIEYAKPYWRHAADRCRRHGLRNVRMLHAEAAYFLRNYVAPTSVRQFHIYFPDPWPKKRHNKRRLVQAPFLRLVHDLLVPVGDAPAGQIRIATDHADYFEWMQEHAQQVSDVFERVDFESPESAGEGELVGTNFERKYRREGRPFFGMILRKRPGR